MNPAPAVTPAEPEPTPILDRQAPMPAAAKPAGRGCLRWGCGLGSFYFACIVLALWQPPPVEAFVRWLVTNFASIFTLPRSGLGLLGYILAFVFASFPALVLHELAHALVGIAVGFRFISMRLGRIEIHRGFRVVHYRGTGAGSGGWFGGWVNLLPDRTDRLALRAVAMIAAGPLANLLSALVVAQLPLTGRFSRFFLLISLILGVVNLFPFRSQAVLSDGARILMLLRNRERGERWLALMHLQPEVAAGKRAEEWPADLIAKAIAIRDDTPDTVIAHSFAYAVAYWQRRTEDAARYLEICLRYSAFVAPPVREALMCDASIFQSRRRGRIDLAEQWLAAMPAKTELPSLRERAEAGILEAKGDVEGALAKLDEAAQALAQLPNPVQRQIATNSLQRWRGELEAQLGTGAPEPGPPA